MPGEAELNSEYDQNSFMRISPVKKSLFPRKGKSLCQRSWVWLYLWDKPQVILKACYKPVGVRFEKNVSA